MSVISKLPHKNNKFSKIPSLSKVLIKFHFSIPVFFIVKKKHLNVEDLTTTVFEQNDLMGGGGGGGAEEALNCKFLWMCSSMNNDIMIKQHLLTLSLCSLLKPYCLWSKKQHSKMR